MHLPKQSKPIQRTLTAQPFANEEMALFAGSNEQGLGAQGGVQPSGFDFGSLLGNIASVALPSILSAI
jgi:hypothetical protein